MVSKKLTFKQMAERRLGRANVINAVACPVCGVAVRQPCSGPRHPVRLSPHLARIKAASSTTGK